jgi:sulfate adenylyltransferase
VPYGDIVRKHLSSELGFSKKDRDINIRRIGFVASEITKNGGIAICAPIAPYDQTRKDVRRMVEAGGGFVLVQCGRVDRCHGKKRGNGDQPGRRKHGGALLIA